MGRVGAVEDTEDLHVALGGVENAGEDAQEGGLAGSVGANEGGAGGGEGEVDGAEGGGGRRSSGG